MDAIAKRKPWFGISANVVGALAVIAAVLPMWVLPVIAPPPPIDKVVADTAGKIKDRIVAKVKGVPYYEAERRVGPYKMSAVVAVSLGVCAMILAAISFLFHEPRRFATTASMLGAGAIAFLFLSQVVVGALVIIAIGIFLLGLLS